jgi:predicted MFS family arabinose efflux permease
VLITGALMLAVYTIVQTSDHGWASASTIALGAGTLALLAGFLIRESRARTPLVPLGVFRSRIVAGANVVQMLMVAGMFGMFFLGAVYMQRVLGYGPLDVGLAFLPVAVGIGVFSLSITPRLNMRYGARATLLPGLILITAALVMFATAPVHAGYLGHLLPVMLLMGVGAGLSFPSLMTAAMSGATESDSGLASGLVNTSMQVGGALGLAVLATLSSSRTSSLRHSGHTYGFALTSGLHLALTIGAGLVVAAIVIGAVTLRPAVATGLAGEVAAVEQFAVGVPAYSEAA